MKKISVTSSAFSNGEDIPRRYTCNGEDINPPLMWGDVPEGTGSIVVLCEDPDAPKGTFWHWVVFNLPPNLRSLAENISGTPLGGGIEGINSFGKNGYGGACPPKPQKHRYIFKVIAVDRDHLPLNDKATIDDVQAAMQGHILAEGSLMGTYAQQ